MEKITSKDELMELLHNVMFKRKGTVSLFQFCIITLEFLP